MGWRDASVYGGTFYDTPNIDRLAAQGARFTQFYTESPVCSPTRASFIEVTRSSLVAPFVAKGMSPTFRGGARPSGSAFLRSIGPTGRGASNGEGTRANAATYDDALRLGRGVDCLLLRGCPTPTPSRARARTDDSRTFPLSAAARRAPNPGTDGDRARSDGCEDGGAHPLGLV